MKNTKINPVSPFVKWLRIMSLSVVITFAQNQLYGQNHNESLDSVIILELNDGTLIQGKVESVNNKEITLNHKEKGQLVIPKYTVKTQRLAQPEDFVRGRLVHRNPHPSRYFYSPSALPMKKNTGYINASYFTVYQGQFGLTNKLSVGITATLFLQPMLINAKWSEKITDKVHVSFGGQVGRLWWGDDAVVSLAFGNVTFGDAEENITVNLGYGSRSKDKNGIGVSSFCMNKRLSEGISLVGEFFYIDGKAMDPIVMGGPGIRIYTGKKAAWDIGVMVFRQENKYDVFDYSQQKIIQKKELNLLFPLPFFGVTYKI